MVLIDSVSRYVEGVITKDSTNEESFSNGLLEYPQYTRPETFLDKKVPEVLISRSPRKYKQMEKRTIRKYNKTKKTRFIKNKQERTIIIGTLIHKGRGHSLT